MYFFFPEWSFINRETVSTNCRDKNPGQIEGKCKTSMYCNNQKASRPHVIFISSTVDVVVFNLIIIIKIDLIAHFHILIHSTSTEHVCSLVLKYILLLDFYPKRCKIWIYCAVLNISLSHFFFQDLSKELQKYVEGNCKSHFCFQVNWMVDRNLIIIMMIL